MDGLSGRRRALLLIVAAAALFSLGGLAGATLVKSPTERAAEAGPPPASVLTAPVEFRVLADTVVLRGTVTAGGVVEVTPGAAAEGGAPVVTAVRKQQGEQVGPGEVIVEVSGRPVFALPGGVPVFRDLRPGAMGEDIAQLQLGLRDLGFDPGAVDGEFGEGTKRAVAGFYESVGYVAPTTGDEDAVRAADDAVRGAERAVEDAQRALADAREAATAATQPPEPGAPDPVEEAERALQRAREDLDRARADRAELVARSGVMVPAAELVFVPSLPARVSVLNARVGSVVAEPPLLVLSTGQLIVQGRLSPAERDLLEPGMAVEVLSELRGLTASGVVTAIGELTEDEFAGLSHPMTVTPDAPLDPELAGDDVRLTVTAASTGQAVLVVPLAAVSAGADGRTTVTRLLDGDREERVAVTAGVSGDGFVEVTLAGDATLSAGDRVVVGR